MVHKRSAVKVPHVAYYHTEANRSDLRRYAGIRQQGNTRERDCNNGQLRNSWPCGLEVMQNYEANEKERGDNKDNEGCARLVVKVKIQRYQYQHDGN